MKKKIMFYILVFLLLFSGFSVVRTNNIVAAADTPSYNLNSRFSRGVGNTCYYIHTTASSYTNWAYNAARLWEYNGWNNPIYMQQVSSSYATHMDIYGRTPSNDSSLNSNTNAYTTVWNSSGKQMSFGTGNWFYAEIIINKTGAANQATMVHEMGHAFGLAHNASNTSSIMYPYSTGRKVSSPQYVDVKTINRIYGY